MDDKILITLSDFFKSFSDYTRLRILNILLKKESNVSELTKELNISQSLVSHQLKYLKDANFVKSRRDGKSVIYSIADEHIKVILEYALEHIKEDNYETI